MVVEIIGPTLRGGPKKRFLTQQLRADKRLSSNIDRHPNCLGLGAHQLWLR